jgi:hypothetical protein
MIGSSIEALLKQHNTIIIPKLGALTLTTDGVFFNEYIKFNDGKLIKYIAAEHGLDGDAAEDAVVEMVERVNSCSEESGPILIGEIGAFYRLLGGGVGFTDNPSEIIGNSDEVQHENEEKIGESETVMVVPPVLEAELEPEVEVEPEPEPEPEVEPAVEPEPQPEAEPELIEEPEPELQVEIEPEVVVDQVPEVEPEPVPETKQEPASEPTPEIREEVEEVAAVIPPVIEEIAVEEIAIVPPVVEETQVNPAPETKVERVVTPTEPAAEKAVATTEEPTTPAPAPAKPKHPAKRRKKKEEKKKRFPIWLIILLVVLLGGGGVAAWKWDVVNGWFSNSAEVVDVDTPDELEIIPEETEPEEVIPSDTSANAADTNGLESDTVPAEQYIEETIPTPEEVEEVESPQPSTSTPSSSGSYHVIAGAFAYRNNAENLVIVLKTDGFPSASVVREKDGKHYVAYGSYSSRDDAGSAKKDIEAAGKKGWILKY